MDERAHDDNTHGSGSIISGLTDLEGDDTDDFGKLMMQNARDERRLENALRGNVQPFRKARVHPRVGLTLENLERNSNGPNDANPGVAKYESPPSVSSSGGSDPAVRVPSEWGRKGRVRRDWMRTIASDDEQKCVTQEDVTPRRADPAAGMADADRPLPSVEDSPLSRKSTPSSMRRGTAALEGESDWDFTMDLNEASIIASTPYFPRNTALDDIRQREIESLKEQAVTTNVLDRIRERSTSETRRPRAKTSSDSLTNGVAAPEQAGESASSEIRLRKRNNSTKSMTKSLTLSGEESEPAPKSPIMMYKSLETVGVVDRGILANAQTSSRRPDHRREDSHELLRRLARVSSNTPSPGRVAASRPRTAPARQANTNSPDAATGSSGAAESSAPVAQDPTPETTTNETAATARETQTEQMETVKDAEIPDPLPAPEPQPHNEDVTPMPVDRPPMNAKTPVVTGAWIDTPAPRTARRLENGSRSRSQSPQKRSPSKKSPEKQKAPQPEAEPEVNQSPSEPTERIRPALPRSALEAIVEEEKAHNKSQRHSDGYGDSTIDSLEDLMHPNGEIENPDPAELDEDTLQGLGIPTGVPRTEAERQRRQELLHLHRMNDRLRAARTSIRDASRGMKRVENRVENVEEVVGGDAVRVVYRDCPCAEGGHQCTPFSAAWNTVKSLFFDRKRSRFTWLSIALLTLVVWYIVESIACDHYCHKFYATSMKGFGVEWDAPRFPYVIPTMLYRKILQPITQPVVWTWNSLFENEEARVAATRTARKVTTRIMQARTQHTWDADADAEQVLGMGADEVI